MKRKIILYNANLKPLAQKLRNNSTPGEIKLWQELKGKRFYGYDFHRQKPLLNYIVDFYCAEFDLVIELDGRYHESVSEADELRDSELRAYKLTIMRFSETEVIKDMNNVLRTLTAYLEYRVGDITSG